MCLLCYHKHDIDNNFVLFSTLCLTLLPFVNILLTINFLRLVYSPGTLFCSSNHFCFSAHKSMHSFLIQHKAISTLHYTALYRYLFCVTQIIRLKRIMYGSCKIVLIIAHSSHRNVCTKLTLQTNLLTYLLILAIYLVINLLLLYYTELCTCHK